MNSKSPLEGGVIVQGAAAHVSVKQTQVKQLKLLIGSEPGYLDTKFHLILTGPVSQLREQ